MINHDTLNCPLSSLQGQPHHVFITSPQSFLLLLDLGKETSSNIYRDNSVTQLSSGWIKNVHMTLLNFKLNFKFDTFMINSMMVPSEKEHSLKDASWSFEFLKTFRRREVQKKRREDQEVHIRIMLCIYGFERSRGMTNLSREWTEGSKNINEGRDFEF